MFISLDLLLFHSILFFQYQPMFLVHRAEGDSVADGGDVAESGNVAELRAGEALGPVYGGSMV